MFDLRFGPSMQSVLGHWKKLGVLVFNAARCPVRQVSQDEIEVCTRRAPETVKQHSALRLGISDKAEAWKVRKPHETRLFNLVGDPRRIALERRNEYSWT